MSEYTTPLHIAVEIAREALADADGLPPGSSRDQLLGSHAGLKCSLRALLAAIAADRPARMAVQHDQGCRNLALAARREIQAARASVARLESFEQALSRALWPDEGDAEPDESSGSGRCPAAHPDDPSPCVGPVVVTVLDAQNAGADGCEHHAARLLAALERGRVYGLPGAPEGSAIRVFNAAAGMRPFPWVLRGGEPS